VEKNDSRRLHHTISIFCRVSWSPEFNAGSPLAGVCARVALPCLLRLFFLSLEAKKKNGREKLPAVSGGGLCRSYPTKLHPPYLPPLKSKD
jgi:hypothetical protein